MGRRIPWGRTRTRWWSSAVVAICLLLALAGCSGRTTGATNVTFNSATLNYIGSCASGEHCSWYAQYRQVGTASWTKLPAAPKGPATGPVSNVSLSEKVGSLTAGTQYEYQACGNGQVGNAFACAGPDGTGSSTSTFTTLAAGGVHNSAVPTISPNNDPYNWEHQVVLSASPGTWSGFTPINYAYQWQTCNGNAPTASGFTCKNAVGDGGGSTGSSFTPGNPDVFLYPRVAVTATDSASPASTATSYSLPLHQAVTLLVIGKDLKCQPAGTPKGTIIYLHPGAFFFPESYDDAQSYCQTWTNRGYAVDVVAYPLWDIAGAESAAVQAATSATAAPVFALGTSAGGTLAEWLAVHRDVTAAVSVAGIGDLSTWFVGNTSYWGQFNNNTGMTLAQRVSVSPFQAIGSAGTPAPTLMFSSPADSTVPYQQSVNMLTALQANCGTCGSLTNLTGDHLQDPSWDAPAAAWLSTVQTAPQITTTNQATFTLGLPGSFTIRSSGASVPALSEAGTLPAGVTFTDNNNGTATLAGTPSSATAGSYALTLTAHGLGPDAKLPFTLTMVTGTTQAAAIKNTAVAGATASTYASGMTKHQLARLLSLNATQLASLRDVKAHGKPGVLKALSQALRVPETYLDILAN